MSSPPGEYTPRSSLPSFIRRTLIFSLMSVSCRSGQKQSSAGAITTSRGIPQNALCSPQKSDKGEPTENPKSTKLHSSQVSCSSCPAGDPQQMDPAEQKLVQNVCGHAPQVNKWPKSHAMTTKIPKILLRQYLVILWFCEEWWPQRVPETKQKWVACNACM